MISTGTSCCHNPQQSRYTRTGAETFLALIKDLTLGLFSSYVNKIYELIASRLNSDMGYEVASKSRSGVNLEAHIQRRNASKGWLVPCQETYGAKRRMVFAILVLEVAVRPPAAHLTPH